MNKMLRKAKAPLSALRGHVGTMRRVIIADPLNHGHRLRLLRDYVRWHALHKHRDRKWKIEFENGLHSMVYPFPDHDAGELNIWTRNVDYHDTRFIRSVIGRGDFIVDAGCNVGNRTLALADLLGGALLIDAGKRAGERTRENLRLNNLDPDSFVVIRAAVGDQCGVVRFSDFGGASTQNRVLGSGESDQRTVEVPLTTIDDEVERFGRFPAFIKIDVEGYDLLALRGSGRTLRSGFVKLVKFEHNQSEPLLPLESFFFEMGWQVFALDSMGKPTLDRQVVSSNVNLFAMPTDAANKLLQATAPSSKPPT